MRTSHIRMAFVAALVACAVHPLAAQSPATCVRSGSHVTIQSVARDTACVLKSGAVSYTVTITAANPAPAPTPAPIDTLATPTPSSAACAHEPAGYTLIEDQPWNSALPSGWRDRHGDWLKAKGALAVDSAAPVSPPSVVAGLFPNGAPGGSGPFYIDRPFAANEQFHNLYLCLEVKHSADFDNTNGNVGTKFIWPAADQVDGTQLYLTFNAAEMEFGLNQQGAESRNLHANTGHPSTVADRRGRWVQYEVLMRGNSSNSVADGGADIWVDGVQTHHYTDVRYQMGAARTWLSLAWNPTYGGGLHPVPHDQWEFIDNLRISGSNR